MTGIQAFFEGLLFLQNAIVPIFTALSVLFFLWGFLKHIWASGHEKEREKGKKLMLRGVAALLILIVVWGILNFINVRFNNFAPIDTSDTSIDANATTTVEETQ